MAFFSKNTMFYSAIGEIEPFVELSFPVRGRSLPADHGYGLYAALVHQCGAFHEQEQLQILTIPGIPDRAGKILLTQQSHLRIRVPLSQIPLVYAIAGKKIRIGIHPVDIGIPAVSLLRPVSTLKARIVVLKGYSEPDVFLAAAQRQLDALEISGQVSIPLQRDGKFSRKTIKIKRHQIVGFTTKISNLSNEDSLKLQQFGLGGRRKMGAGIFVPSDM